MASEPSKGGFWLPMASLWHRELVRFLRQPSRIVGLLAAPLLFWFFFGSGMGESFHPPAALTGEGYLQYFFPGTVVMIVLFTSIFSNMSTIEDRREGFLQSVLVAPIPRASLVVGKILGGATQAMLPGILFLLLAPVVGFRWSLGRAAEACGIVFLIAFSLTSLGFAIAWWMDSVQGFHAVLNLVLIPLWLLSGALFPASGASAWVRAVMQVNPLTYEVSALRAVLYDAHSTTLADVIPLDVSLQVTALFCAVSLAAALAWAGRPTVRHLA